MPARAIVDRHAARGRISARAAVALTLITLLAFAARAAGLSFQLPHTPGIDEMPMFVQLEHERGLGLRPGKPSMPYAYPRLLTRTANALLPQAPTSAPKTLDEHLERAMHDVLAMRWMIVAIASLAIPLTFALARRFTSDFGACLAAALLGASLLHALYSSQARPHAALTTFTLAAILACLRVHRRGDTLSYVAAGVACAAACATLHSGVFTLPALVVAHVLRERPASPRALLRFVLAFAIVAAALVWAFPPEPPRPHAALGDEGATDPIRGHGTALSDFSGAGFAAIARAFANYDAWIALLAAAGVIAWIVATARRPRERAPAATSRERWNERGELLVVLAHAVPHVLVFGMFERTFQRFMLPIVPYVCCAAACFAVSVATTLAARTRSSRAVWSSVLALACVAPPAVVCWRFSALKRAPDTQELAAEWIASHLERTQTRIVMSPTFDVPLARDEAGQRLPLLIDPFAFPLWTFHQVTRAPSELAPLAWRIDDAPLRLAAQRRDFERDPEGFLRELGATHAVVEVVAGKRRPLMQELRDAARASGRLVARFAPRDGVEGDPAIVYQLDGPNAPEADFAWRVARFDRLGPEIEIYELAR